MTGSIHKTIGASILAAISLFGCRPVSLPVYIHNDTGEPVQLTYFVDYFRTSEEETTLPRGGTFIMILPPSWEQVITAKTSQTDAVQFRFNGPFTQEVGFSYYVCIRREEGRLEITDHVDGGGGGGGAFNSLDPIESLGGEVATLPNVGIIWEESTRSAIPVELISQADGTMTFTAPTVNGQTMLRFVAIGCSSQESYELTVHILPAS